MAELVVTELGDLRRAIVILSTIAKEATINYSADGLSLTVSADSTKDRPILCILLIRPSNLEFFRCDVKKSAGINLSQFMDRLVFAGTDCSMRILGIDGSNEIAFEFEHYKTHELDYSEMQLSQPNDDHFRITDALQNDYPRIVGLPSAKFRSIIRKLTGWSRRVTVMVSITSEHVKFSAMALPDRVLNPDTITSKEILLSRQQGECEISGVTAEENEYVLINMYHRKALGLATFASTTLQILHSDTSPPMLKFSSQSLGTIMFFLLRDED